MIFQVMLFVLAALVGWTFDLAGMPIPWLLGGLAVALIAKTQFAEKASWPRVYRSAGLVVIGYTPRGAIRHIFSMRKANDREQARISPYLEV